MKTLIAGFCIVAAGIMAGCNDSTGAAAKGGGLNPASKKTQADTAHFTTVQWTDSLVNIGTLTMGDKTEVKFHFKNTGNYPLIIANVVAGCGCTIPGYTKEPVAPGGEGVVTGAFDTKKSHPGTLRKNILVTANTKPRQQFELVFTGEIKEAK